MRYNILGLQIRQQSTVATASKTSVWKWYVDCAVNLFTPYKVSVFFWTIVLLFV